MEQRLIQNALAYASIRGLQLAERLGFGIHGIIFATIGNFEEGNTAIKVHRDDEPYIRERDIYERLKAAGISEIFGFNVPQMLRFDDELRVIEMTIVVRPFVLDFAGAWLDFPPAFSEDIWADWEKEKREQFGDNWDRVQEILAYLEILDIHMIDVSPSNVAFPLD